MQVGNPSAFFQGHDHKECETPDVYSTTFRLALRPDYNILSKHSQKNVDAIIVFRKSLLLSTLQSHNKHSSIKMKTYISVFEVIIFLIVPPLRSAGFLSSILKYTIEITVKLTAMAFLVLMHTVELNGSGPKPQNDIFRFFIIYQISMVSVHIRSAFTTVC